MSDLSTSGRLELIRQIRSTYNRNMYDMTNRERLIYGRQTVRNYDNPVRQTDFDPNYHDYTNDTNVQNRNDGGVSLFKVRLIAGILLFFLLFAMDSANFTIAGHTADDIFEAISYDYVNDIDTFLNLQSGKTGDQ